MRILLDAHVPKVVAEQLRRRGIDAVALSEWMDGKLRIAPDREILIQASAEGRVLVTYDRRTIPSLLVRMAEDGRHHAGVIVVPYQRLHPSSIGGLVRSLLALIAERGDEDWEDAIVFLQAV